MFSGIIEELGIVKDLNRAGAVTKLDVLAPKICPGIKPGQSVCVNGVCLTVAQAKNAVFSFEIIPQTLRCTSLGLLKRSDCVNLERALRTDSRIDGHFVTGHIDGTGVIIKKFKRDADIAIEISAEEQMLHYVVLRGSVALDGVSLTVAAVESGSFRVNLIPYTLKNTTLGLKKEQDKVNIECDILGKYINKFAAFNRKPPASGITSSLLSEHGFI